VIVEHALLYPTEGEVDEARGARGFDAWHAVDRRPGRDLTLVTSGGSLPRCLAAAEALASSGIDAAVIDLRCLRPLDFVPVLESVATTHRCLVVDEGWRTCGLAAEVAAAVTEHAFFDLDAPVARVCSAEVPIPYAKHLEDAALPGVERIVAAARGLCDRSVAAA
jgi:pyruvate dehydrogenase E1 component beta subunit